jgi:hypothetical protein
MGTITMTSRIVFWVIAAASMLLSTAVHSQTYTAVSYDYATIAYPCAVSTSANGINNSNVVVGSYLDSSFTVHGFFRDGHYSKVDVPGSTETEIRGINDKGDIIGVYQIAGPLNFQGFLRYHDQFTTIDDPQATFGTTAFAINDKMEIVGSFDDSQGSTLKDGTFKNYKPPQQAGGLSQIQLNGINNLGWIAGQVLSGGNWRGFWMVGDDQDFLEPPNAGDNQVTGIMAAQASWAATMQCPGLFHLELKLVNARTQQKDFLFSRNSLHAPLL